MLIYRVVREGKTLETFSGPGARLKAEAYADAQNVERWQKAQRERVSCLGPLQVPAARVVRGVGP